MYRPFEEFNPSGKLISVIGSGGKTTFLRYLSARLPGTVILTTSTHIRPFPDIPLIDTASADRMADRISFRSAEVASISGISGKGHICVEVVRTTVPGSRADR